MNEQRARSTTEWIEQAQSLRGFLESIAKAFHHSPESGRLQQALFASSDSRYALASPDEVVLLALAQCTAEVDIDSQSIDVRAAKLATRDVSRISALSDMVADSAGVNRTRVLVAIANALDSASTNRFSHRVLGAFAKVRPDLLLWPSIWERFRSEQAVLLDVVQEQAHNVELHRVLSTALSAGISVSFDQWAPVLGVAVIETIITATADLPRVHLDSGWMTALRDRRVDVAIALSDRVQTTTTLWMAASVFCGLGTKPSLDWFGVDWRQRALRLDQPDELNAAVTLLGLGLRSGSRLCGYAISEAFPIVYSAAAAGRLWGTPWEEVQGELPTIWQWWDKCERLVQGVVRHFLDVDQTPEVVLSTFLDPFVLDRALRYLKGNYEARGFLSALLGQSNRVSEAQRAVLSRHRPE